VVRVKDRAEAAVWLDDQPPEIAMVFAARCALRALPELAFESAVKPAAFLQLATLRATIISAVAGHSFWAELRVQAEAAADMSLQLAAHLAGNNSATAAASAARTVVHVKDQANHAANAASHSAAAIGHLTYKAAYKGGPDKYSKQSEGAAIFDEARTTTFSAIEVDVQTLEQSESHRSVFDIALWPTATQPTNWEELLSGLRRFWQNDPKVWDYWGRWYEGFLNGNPLNWDIQFAITSLPDEDWNKGPEWIAGKIAGIERDFLSKRAPLAETIEFNPETNKLHAIPLDIAKPDLVTATLSQVSDALEDVLADPSNGLNPTSREVRVAQRTLDKYADDPQQIELNLVSVAAGLRRQLFDTFELPETEENRAFLQTAEDGAVAIRATHPAVAENREILARQKFVELPDDDKAVLEAALEPLLLLSEWQIADDFKQDIPALINTSVGPSGDYAPPLPAVTRTFGRITRISQEMEQEDTFERIRKTKAFARAEVIVVGGSFITLMNELVQIGLRLFGVL